MVDIWDDLYEIQSDEDIEDLLERINIVLQKGISSVDQRGFIELQGNLQELLTDINFVKEATNSRKSFEEISERIKEKYIESDFDFEVLPIIEGVIKDSLNELDKKEVNWKKANMSLGDKSRISVHNWKEKTKILPEYLSDSTLTELKKLAKEAEDIISEGKIDDVVFYFEKLDAYEKKNCIKKLIKIMETM